MTPTKGDTALKLGEEGRLVGEMQEALIERGFLPRFTKKGRRNKDNDYGSITAAAVLKFQQEMANLGLLSADEVTGHTAGLRTLSLLYAHDTLPTETLDWPSRPKFGALGEEGTRRIFGNFPYTPKRAPNKNGAPIKIGPTWRRKNLTTILIPQLKGVPLYYPSNPELSSGRITCHVKAADKFRELFEAIEAHGLLPLIQTYDGVFNPRFQRGSYTAISNHAWGTAIDLNAYANRMGRKPAAMGEDGCLLPIVDVATSAGFWWGGFWRGTSIDGMHFEIAVL